VYRIRPVFIGFCIFVTGGTLGAIAGFVGGFGFASVIFSESEKEENGE
jgi:hypothetical protein